MLNNKDDILVKNIIIKRKNIPILFEDSLIKDVIEEMNKHALGVCFCISKNNQLLGILTDGDLRRKILTTQKPISAFLSDYFVYHINKKPKKVFENEKLVNAVKLMEKSKIWDLPVVNNKNKLCGLLHLHPVVKYLLIK